MNSHDSHIAQINPDHIRKVWHNNEWHYSVVDIVAQLLDKDTQQASTYWRKLKSRLIDEGNETVTNCHRLKLPAEDGKMRLTDVVTTEQALRLIQSIPSPKVEPMKLWLANVGAQRLHEIENPDDAIDAAIRAYLAQGKDERWIKARLEGKIKREKFTSALQAAVTELLTRVHYAMATDEVYKGLWGRTAAILKGELTLPVGSSLRDNQPALALTYQGIAEEVSAQKLGERTELSFAEAKEIVRVVANLIGVQARATGRFLNVDLATGKSLLSGR